MYNQDRLPRGSGIITNMATLLNIAIVTSTTAVTVTISVFDDCGHYPCLLVPPV